MSCEINLTENLLDKVVKKSAQYFACTMYMLFSETATRDEIPREHKAEFLRDGRLQSCQEQ